MSIEEANKELSSCPETIFDQFDLSIKPNLVGHSLRDRLVELSNLYGRINELATRSYFLYEKAKIRRDKVESIACASFDGGGKVTDKKILIKDYEIDMDGERTNLNRENEKLSIYEYIHSRGKDKVREVSTILDIGRTLLSWDKNESGKSVYD